MSTPNASIPAKIDLTTFLLSIASAAYMGLGLNPRPGSAKTEENLELAKQNIDLLELMQTKTKGNLTSEESKLLDQLLFELRMRFVEKTKNVTSKPL